jgi:DNA polymerase elongation subunit (family B)
LSRDVREYAVEARASQGSRELIAEGVDVHSGEKISFVITNAKAKIVAECVSTGNKTARPDMTNRNM